LKENNYSIDELKTNGFTLKDFKLANYELADIKNSFGLSINDYLNAGFDLKELNQNFTLTELINAGAALLEFKKIGMIPNDFYDNNISFYQMFTQLDYTYGELEELYKSKNKLLKNGNHDTDFDSIIKNCKKLFSMKTNCKFDAKSKNQVIILDGGKIKSIRKIKKQNNKSLRRIN
jgi:hypothetical protein